VTAEQAGNERNDQPEADADTAAWTELITRYYNGCSSSDVQLMTGTLHPDVVHWFLAGNVGTPAVHGADHLARYWRKVARPIQARWVVDTICASADQAVIEWTMFWVPPGSSNRVATRGAEWFVRTDGLISEIRSYYRMRPEDTGLDGFPYAERGYSTQAAECSSIHPAADTFHHQDGDR
jgi:ketosteroid isomerase-like protein